MITNMTVKISSGTTVPQVYVVATQTATNAYGKTGTGLPGGCTIVTSTGGPYAGTIPVVMNAAPPTVFTISLPTCISSAGSSILVGASYQIQILGTYGYTAQLLVTASG
jgi:hypothetical protein